MVQRHRKILLAPLCVLLLLHSQHTVADEEVHGIRHSGPNRGFTPHPERFDKPSLVKDISRLPISAPIPATIPWLLPTRVGLTRGTNTDARVRTQELSR